MNRTIHLFFLIVICFFANNAFSNLELIAKEYDAGNLDKAIHLSDRNKYKNLHLFLKAQSFLDKKNKSSFETIKKFLLNNPNIPQKNALIDAMEQKIDDKTPSSHIIGWFSHNKPRTPNGYYQYYRASSQKLKDKEAIKSIVRDAWINGNLTKKQSKSLYEKYKSILREDDHADKISNLLWRKKIDEARDYIPLLADKHYKEAFIAWISIIKHGKSAENEFHKTKGSYRYISGLLYSYLKLHQKTDPNSELVQLYSRAPKDEEHAKEWWSLRNYFARELIEKKMYSEAYKVVAGHSNTEIC
ncbi:MAG: hypothetical protein SFT91_05580, partial [Rickettsiaceae bacterium]|nr:hypothetical protein [Rickettsiaceae bacterium]